MQVCLEPARHSEVRAELGRILASPNFVTSDRNRRFLEHIVKETLAGRADRLKGYSIATTVFRRPDDFDDQFDPVVRMEAGRLRRALERFYLVEGQRTHVRISVPKGGYKPDFLFAAEAVQAAEEQLSSVPGAIVVKPFEVEGPLPTYDLGVGLTHQLMLRLHQRGLVVALRASGSEFGVVTGHFANSGNVLSATALLIESSSGQVSWGDKVQREVSDGVSTLAVRNEIAGIFADGLHRTLSRLQADRTNLARASCSRPSARRDASISSRL